MTKEAFRDSLQQEMASVHVSPQLRRRVVLAAQGKEEKPMKKKLSMAAVLAIVAVALCAAAVAAAYNTGILDFTSRYYHTYVPDDAQSYIQSNVLKAENDLVCAEVGEMYYDGRTVRFTLNVTPKDPKVMLLGMDLGMEDFWGNMQLIPDESDMRTVLDVYCENGCTSAYAVDGWMWTAEDEMTEGSGDYCLNADGVFTQYSECEFQDEQPTRNAKLKIYLTPVRIGNENQTGSESIILECPITLETAAKVDEVYVSTEPLEFPEVGVRVDRVQITVKPQDLYADIEYTVVDSEAFAAQEDGLWFEFVDPDSTEEEPYNQRLSAGLGGGGSTHALDEEWENATRFHQTETLGRNELHTSYTLRPYNAFGKGRYPSVTFKVEKVQEEGK